MLGLTRQMMTMNRVLSELRLDADLLFLGCLMILCSCTHHITLNSVTLTSLFTCVLFCVQFACSFPFLDFTFTAWSWLWCFPLS
jgi:hypothetical protein